jgi:hypothetical protein
MWTVFSLSAVIAVSSPDLTRHFCTCLRACTSKITTGTSQSTEFTRLVCDCSIDKGHRPLAAESCFRNVKLAVVWPSADCYEGGGVNVGVAT